jgi:predicted methyltransferase
MRFPTLKTLFFLLLLLALTPGAIADESPKASISGSQPTINSIINSNQRSQLNRHRDKYRHPAQTLKFFGLRPEMTVVELWPGTGWYTEILAPFLARKGQLIVTNFDPQTNKAAQAFEAILAGKYGADLSQYSQLV